MTLNASKKNLKRIAGMNLVPFLFAAAAVPAMTGCTDEEVLTVIGVVAIGVAIGAGGGGGSGHSGGDHGGGHPGPGPGPGSGHGSIGPVGPGHGGGFGGGGPRPGGRMMVSSVAKSVVNDEVEAQSVTLVSGVDLERFSEVFGVSVRASEIFITAMQAAKDGNGEPLKNLGLAHEDLQALAGQQMITESGLLALSQGLGESPEATRSLLEKMIELAKPVAAGASDAISAN